MGLRASGNEGLHYCHTKFICNARGNCIQLWFHLDRPVEDADMPDAPRSCETYPELLRFEYSLPHLIESLEAGARYLELREKKRQTSKEAENP